MHIEQRMRLLEKKKGKKQGRCESPGFYQPAGSHPRGHWPASTSTAVEVKSGAYVDRDDFCGGV